MDRSEALSPEELAEVGYVKNNMWKHPPMAQQPVAPFPYRMSMWPDELPPDVPQPGEQQEFFPSSIQWTVDEIQSIADGMEVEYQRALEEQMAGDVQVGGAHYKKCSLQPWDYVAANNLDYFQGSIIKYITRWKDKGGVQDLEKARHFLDKYIELQGE